MSQGLTITSTSFTQCQVAQIAWTGPTGMAKTIQMFIDGTEFFAETIARGTTDMEQAAGTVNWMVDVPAGLNIALQISNDNSSVWATTPFRPISSGTTGDCLLKNNGQLAVAQVSAMITSLYASSANLFPYLATQTGTAPVFTSVPDPNDHSSPISIPAIAGIAAGGAVAVIILVLGLFFFCRRKNRKQTKEKVASISGGDRTVGTSTITTNPFEEEKYGNQVPPAKTAPQQIGQGRTFVSVAVEENPIEAWQNQLRPASRGTYVYSPATPAPDDTVHQLRYTPTVPALPLALASNLPPNYASSSSNFYNPTTGSILGAQSQNQNPTSILSFGESSFMPSASEREASHFASVINDSGEERYYPRPSVELGYALSQGGMNSNVMNSTVSSAVGYPPPVPSIPPALQMQIQQSMGMGHSGVPSPMNNNHIQMGGPAQHTLPRRPSDYSLTGSGGQRSPYGPQAQMSGGVSPQMNNLYGGMMGSPAGAMQSAPEIMEEPHHSHHGHGGGYR